MPSSGNDRRVKPFFLLGIFGVVALVLVDFVAMLVGSTFSRLHQDPAVWGTYGDWAVAILPPAGLLFAVVMWRQESRERDEEIRNQLGKAVYLSRSPNRVIVQNGSLHQIYVRDPTDQSLRCVAAGGEEVFGGEIGELEFITVREDRWLARLDQPSERCDPHGSMRPVSR